MDTSWTRRGLAFLVLVVLLGGAVGVPVLASTGSSAMEKAMDRYEDRSDSKLAWLEHQLEVADSNQDRLESYTHSISKLRSYADEARAKLFVIAGNDPELLILAQELTGEIHEMEQEYLAEATELYEESLTSATTTTTTKPKNPTTTTVAVTSTTTTTRPRNSTTTTVARVSTTTSSTTSTTTPTPAPTSTTSTTSTVPTPTVNVPTRNTPPPGPDSPTNTTSTPVVTTTTTTPAQLAFATPAGTSGGIVTAPSGASNFALAPEALPTDVGTDLPSESTLVPDPDLVTRLGSSELLPITGMLLKYVPADLPGNMATPVVGLLAIFEMVAGAFVASLRQLGGPLTAAAMYLVYSVWRHLVEET